MSPTPRPIALPIRYHDAFVGYTVRRAKNGWKTCRRGHKYRGSTRCPTCWNVKGAPESKSSRRRSTRRR